MEFGADPTKRTGSEKRTARLGQMLDGWSKADPATKKMLPVEADVPEFLVALGQAKGASEQDAAVGDLTLIAFYYLLRVGEYTKKGKRNGTKQTVQFRMKDLLFFRRNSQGQLRLLGRDADAAQIMSADGCTLRISNQKNGWKNVCIFQESNGCKGFDPIRALGRRFLHVREHAPADTFPDTELSAFYADGKRHDVSDKMISAGLKVAATALDYPGRKSIPIDRIDTHSLRSGGANALSLCGYSDTAIQKMGRWRGATFKEYVREQLEGYSAGMSKDMQQKFNFVNVEAGVDDAAYTDVTRAISTTPYEWHLPQ